MRNRGILPAQRCGLGPNNPSSVILWLSACSSRGIINPLKHRKATISDIGSDQEQLNKRTERQLLS